MRCFTAVALCILIFPATADDWTGKSIRVKENGLKLGRKVGDGLARDGAALDAQKVYAVKADDGTLLELEGGFILRPEAEAVADVKTMPKKARGEVADKDKGEWFGKKVLPRRDPNTIRMGDWIGDKQEYWTPRNLLYGTVREDCGGFLRLYDDRREGWVAKEDMVAAEDAPAWWDKAVKESPNNAYGWNMRGLSWYAKREYDKAIEDYTESIRLAPADAYTFILRGLVWLNTKEYEKAAADFSEAIRLDPTYAVAYSNRGIVWDNRKDYDKAIADYTQSLRCDPNDADTYNARGLAWTRTKQYGKAVADLAEAIFLDPNSADAYRNRGAVFNEIKEYEKAIADCTEAIRLDPKDANSYGQRALAYFETNRFRDAQGDFVRAIDLRPMDWVYRDYARFRSTCSDAKYRNGEKALEIAKQALEMAKEADWKYHSALASAYAETGDFESAAAAQRKALDMLKAEKYRDKDDLKDAEARLELYRAKKPYRQGK